MKILDWISDHIFETIIIVVLFCVLLDSAGDFIVKLFT